jgi:hypothetical protein
VRCARGGRLSAGLALTSRLAGSEIADTARAHWRAATYQAKLTFEDGERDRIVECLVALEEDKFRYAVDLAGIDQVSKAGGELHC